MFSLATAAVRLGLVADYLPVSARSGRDLLPSDLLTVWPYHAISISARPVRASRASAGLGQAFRWERLSAPVPLSLSPSVVHRHGRRD